MGCINMSFGHQIGILLYFFLYNSESQNKVENHKYEHEYMVKRTMNGDPNEIFESIKNALGPERVEYTQR